MAVPSAFPSPDPDAVWPDDAIEVGRIVDAWGVKGWIKVQPYSGDPQALFSSKRWFLQPPEDKFAKPRPPGAPAWPNLLRVSQAKDHGDVVVAQVHDVVDRNGAEALRGGRIFVSRASFPTADANEFYWVDLVGLDVVNREGVSLGAVVDLLDTGAHSVLRIEDKTSDKTGTKPVERLIPFVDAYVDSVDLPGKRITVDWSSDWDLEA